MVTSCVIVLVSIEYVHNNVVECDWYSQGNMYVHPDKFNDHR